MVAIAKRIAPVAICPDAVAGDLCLGGITEAQPGSCIAGDQVALDEILAGSSIGGG